MQRAIAYIRVSDQRQVDEGGSLQTQERQVRSYAESLGYELVEIYMEEGETAKTSDRHELQRMLRFCRQRRGIASLIVPRIDRLARYSFDYSQIKMELNRVGIRIESVTERLEDTPAGRFMENVLASQAQFDNEVRGERSKNGMIDAVAEGRYVWKAPKGYRNVRIGRKATIEPVPAEAEIIRRAFQFLASGCNSAQWVLLWLHAQGMTLSRSQFYRLLDNRVYIGIIDAFGQSHKAAPPFVGLVSEGTFYAARKALSHKSTPETYLSCNPDFPLRGTVRCTCGAFLSACWSRGRTKGYPYYLCRHCRRVNIRRDNVEEAFVEELRAYRPVPSQWEFVTTAITLRWKQRNADFFRRHKTTESKIEKVEALQAAIIRKNAEGVVPDAIAKKQISELEDRLEVLKALLHQTRSKGSLADILIYAHEFLTQLADTWHSSSADGKQRIQKFMFPEGLILKTDSGRRTDEKWLSEGKPIINCVSKSHLVDLPPEKSEELLDWMIRLYETARLGDDLR